MTREQLESEYALFQFAPTGLGGFAGPQMHDEVYDRLTLLGHQPLTKVQLNQLLVLSKAGCMSDGFLRYYWCTQPCHPYDVTALPFHSTALTQNATQQIVSHDLLRWGLYRLFVDGLLFFGSIAAAYNALRSRS